MLKITGCAYAIAGVALLAGCARDGTPEMATTEVVDQLLGISSLVGDEPPRWSPDGSRILLTASSILYSVDSEGGVPEPLTDDLAGAGHFLASHSPRWSPDGEWIAYLSDRTGATEIWLQSVTDGTNVQLTQHGARINAFRWSPDGQTIAFSGNRYGDYDIWTVAVADHATRRLTHDPAYEVFPAWTPDSNIVYVRLDERWVDHEVIEIAATGGSPRVLVRDTNFFDYGAGSTFGYPEVSPNGQFVLFPSYRSGWVNYWIAPIDGGEPRRIAPAEADQGEAAWSPDGRWIAYTENHNGTHDLRVAPAAGGDPRVLVAPRRGVVAHPSWSPDGRQLAYTLETPTHPGDLFRMSFQSGEVLQLTFSSIEEGSLFAPEKITYPSSDGFEIPAYLYPPPRRTSEQRFPAIVWTHGGPSSQYRDTYHVEAQFFAQNGYVVLLPNIRGSSGYGRTFEDANNGCWGHCDLKDVLAGVEYLKTLPFVDGSKMATTGSSYGGFMTCAAITFAPDVFDAAIAASGYCNRVAFVDEGELRHIQQLEHEFGPYEENSDVYYRNSPYFFVKNVRTPTFFLHGKGRYPGSPQMEEFARVMQKEYKTFRYKAYLNENYYVRGRTNRRQMLLDMLRFFDFYLKGRPVELPGVTYVEERW